MDAGSRITLVVGVVTAVVALIGYWSNQHTKRRETRVYAEALLAIHHYEELPSRPVLTGLVPSIAFWWP
ncbi:hypothetical protein ACNPQM_40830 [Streptomyces sp. NPDC056231]|uniref:hypothetical protein n=1 Tax=Streptomyces sp. NPDC056231 TaxID=3345755 RepID=UPI003AADF809